MDKDDSTRDGDHPYVCCWRLWDNQWRLFIGSDDLVGVARRCSRRCPYWRRKRGLPPRGGMSYQRSATCPRALESRAMPQTTAPSIAGGYRRSSSCCRDDLLAWSRSALGSPLAGVQGLAALSLRAKAGGASATSVEPLANASLKPNCPHAGDEIRSLTDAIRPRSLRPDFHDLRSLAAQPAFDQDQWSFRGSETKRASTFTTFSCNSVHKIRREPVLGEEPQHLLRRLRWQSYAARRSGSRHSISGTDWNWSPEDCFAGIGLGRS